MNKVQLDIRTGHAQTVDKVLVWIGDSVEGVSVCDAGCGTGSLSIPLALRVSGRVCGRVDDLCVFFLPSPPHLFPHTHPHTLSQGAAVTATDISAAMAAETERRYKATIAAGASPPPTHPVFQATCLEDVTGTYHTVTCIDVLIHYPQAKVDAMLTGLVSHATDRLIVSFAPSTPYYEALKRVGELFPKGAKATRAYLHKEEDVEAALARAGWTVTRKEMTATKFYFSRLFEAVPTAKAA